MPEPSADEWREMAHDTMRDIDSCMYPVFAEEDAPCPKCTDTIATALREAEQRGYERGRAEQRDANAAFVERLGAPGSQEHQTAVTIAHGIRRGV